MYWKEEKGYPYCPSCSAYDEKLSAVTADERTDDLYHGDDDYEWKEKDWEHMKQLYMPLLRRLQQYIDDYLDQMEHENSPMFDDYLDQVRVEQWMRSLKKLMKEQEPELSDRIDEKVLICMLLSEMHHRRWRYQFVSRRFY